ncbi:MAG TPA: hypothetical protein VHP83_02995 [Aggregatilineaceae bacterium]|nr:hypothetical protein [Aggregatilineaceae bacterium]
MTKMITALVAIIAAVLVGVLGYFILRPPVALLSNAEFVDLQISPNADGENDLTTVRYSLARSAQVSIFLENAAGQIFYFRQAETRVKGDYSVLFSGVVDGYQLPDDPAVVGTVERRLMPNGHYTWTIEAVADDKTVTKTGTLDIVNADVALPSISIFDIHPPTFTPNQDGIADRVRINIYLDKPAQLTLYLQDTTGQRYYLSEREGKRELGEMGSHDFDYDGGVDQHMEPPPDGTYDVFAIVQDAEGQRLVRQSQLTIQDGGIPQMEFAPQTTGGAVYYETIPYRDEYYTSSEKTGELLEKPEGVISDLSTITVIQGDLLVFKLTVTNYGRTPVRTAGPFPGTVYDFNQSFATLGAYEEAGGWRVGLKCDTSLSDYPWRWAIAPLDELEQVYDEAEDKTYYYLMPGQNAEVWGAVRLTEMIEAQNPQDCWAGLIHERVEIPEGQGNFGPREVKIVP